MLELLKRVTVVKQQVSDVSVISCHILLYYEMMMNMMVISTVY